MSEGLRRLWLGWGCAHNTKMCTIVRHERQPVVELKVLVYLELLPHMDVRVRAVLSDYWADTRTKPDRGHGSI